MIDELSLQCFKIIVRNGLVSRRKQQVLEYIVKHQPCTAKECNIYYAKQGENSSSFMSRFGELEDLGVIHRVGTKIDPHTSKECWLYSMTGNVPKKLDKKVKIKCNHCNGKGHVTEQQERMF